MFNFIDKIFDVSSSNEITFIPDSLKKDLKENLQTGEEILSTLRVYKANYKAQRVFDSNSFFNAFMILTNQRVIIARNSKRLQKFRDIPLNIIQHQTFETSRDVPVLTIHMLNERDILEFPRRSKDEVEPVINILIDLLESSTKESSENIYCRFCGFSIPQDSNFCENCGKKLN